MNPDHLFLGTQKDNIRDMLSKGRNRNYVTPAGSAHFNARLTVEQVRAMRESRRLGAKYDDLSKRYGVGISLISNICNRKKWKQV